VAFCTQLRINVISTVFVLGELHCKPDVRRDRAGPLESGTSDPSTKPRPMARLRRFRPLDARGFTGQIDS
jgi:hypothetical protein